MGIPSYFSHIIRNYSNIIRACKDFTSRSFGMLFMDCNSIIYDAVHSLPYDSTQKDAYETQIINKVIFSIETYINIIKPTATVFIAFDGVAPFAKMEQQRTRRYRTAYVKSLMSPSSTSEWDTSAITPGTHFMMNLSRRVQYAFENMENKYKVSNIIVSGANEPGEGEHKLFEYLRKQPNPATNIALYGLDSDLIMLSLFHLQYCNNIYIFREAPEFLKHYFPVDSAAPADMPYFLDMKVLASSILTEMNCANYDTQRIYDYIFLCFFLGNDFLPHFPAMNIRTHGIQVILDIYRNYIGNRQNTFIVGKDNTIQWKQVNKIVYEISRREHELLTLEFDARAKHDSRKSSLPSKQTPDEYLQNIPVAFRGDELYICPSDTHWEDRYYKVLFGSRPDETTTRAICTNYLEGLEWVFKYYSAGCPHWKWKYNHHYPPLFKDLCKYVPHFNTQFVHAKMNSSKNSHVPFSPTVQLSYVLPPQAFNNLPVNIQTFLTKNYKSLYVDKYEFCWAFCRYFWEAHPLLPEISLELLEQWDIQFKMHFDNVRSK
jgi:5'-3' exonuclease